MIASHNHKSNRARAYIIPSWAIIQAFSAPAPAPRAEPVDSIVPLNEPAVRQSGRDAVELFPPVRPDLLDPVMQTRNLRTTTGTRRHKGVLRGFWTLFSAT